MQGRQRLGREADGVRLNQDTGKEDGATGMDRIDHNKIELTGLSD